MSRVAVVLNCSSGRLAAVWPGGHSVAAFGPVARMEAFADWLGTRNSVTVDAALRRARRAGIIATRVCR